jgi:signal peptidase I
LIKRVIAVEGQTVDVHDDGVFVDGRRLTEPYVYGKPTTPGSVPLPVVVSPGQVWLMGDNRPNSGDSRYFGPLPLDTVRGRAFWTYWPLGAFGRLD